MTPGTLRAIRARLDLNQQKFADMVGAGQSQISELERGKRLIPLQLALAALAVENGIRDLESAL